MDKNNHNTNEMKVGQLLAFVTRMMGSQTDRLMERIGLYRGQAFLLMTLSHQDGLTHSEIAEKLEISPAAATKVIKRTEALSYVQRRSDPSDERISRVFLQDEGWGVIQQIKLAFEQIEARLQRNLSEEEKKTLTHLLLKVYDNLVEQPIE